MKKITYKMKYICSNCGTSFIEDIKVGLRAIGKGGSCPYCGVIDDSQKDTFSFRKPSVYDLERSVGE
jgi:DNA-directed RNA polymerase subunit RPC12/RpoP